MTTATPIKNISHLTKPLFVAMWLTFTIFAGPAPAQDQTKLLDPPRIMQGFVGNATVKIVVNLDAPAAARAAVDFRSEAALKAWRTTVAGLNKEVLASLPREHVSVRHQFENV